MRFNPVSLFRARWAGTPGSFPGLRSVPSAVVRVMAGGFDSYPADRQREIADGQRRLIGKAVILMEV